MTQRKAVCKFVIVSICLALSGCFDATPDPGADASTLTAGRSPEPGNAKPGKSDRRNMSSAAPDAQDGLDSGVKPPECDDADGGLVGPPVLQAHTIRLWPPNHKFHEISIEDCVTVVDPCDPDLHPEFIWASSDEPVDDIGDGHHSPDIQLSDDCQVLAVRAERQGPKDGRVYTLGVRVVNHDGDVSEAACTVVVDHDQRGTVGANSGEAYRITFDGTNGAPACDGRPPVDPPANPPVPPPTTPPATPPGTPDGTPGNPPAVPEQPSPE